MSRWLVAIVALLVFAIPEAADACTCFPGVSRVYPQSGGSVPADGVLAVITNDPTWSTTAPIRDSMGAEVLVQVIAEHTEYGACYHKTQLVKPLAPLTPGASYSGGVGTFTASAPVGVAASDVSIAIELVEHAPEPTFFHYCAAGQDVTRSAGVSLTFTSPSRVLLVAQTRATPAGSTSEVVHGGPLAALEPSSPRSEKGNHRAVGFVPNVTQGCARAYVYDLTGTLLADHEECFDMPPNDAGTDGDSGAPADASAGGATDAGGSGTGGTGAAGASGASSRADSESEGCQLRSRGAAAHRPAWVALLLFGAGVARRKRTVKAGSGEPVRDGRE